MSDPLESIRASLAERYRLEGQVGEGGMAVVYRAHDLKHDRPVAIKVMRPEFAAVLGEERFKREIYTVARLQHPNILPLYDSGSAEGHLFFVMPFVEGEPLRSLITREKQLPLEDALRIAGEAADALSYAHEHGVVHRDIKPENILLHGGHALVADFGIARAIAAAGDRLTRTGVSIGTPAYMSPEQASGDEIDPRSDVYSLSCVVYEMLIGVPPFTGPTPLAILARHTLDLVPSMRIVRSSIPDALEDAIIKALSKTPADRYHTMAQFAQAIRAAGHERPSARLPSPVAPIRRSRWWARRATLVVAATALLAAGAWGIRRWGNSPKSVLVNADPGSRRLAVLYFGTADDSLRYVADALTEGLIDRLRRVTGLDVVSRDGVGTYRGSSLSRESIGRAVKAGTIVIGQVDRATTDVHLTIQLIDVGSDAVFQRKGFSIGRDRVLQSIDSVTGVVADFLRARLGEELVLDGQRGGTRNETAWAFLQRALVASKRADSISRLEGLTTSAALQYQAADSMLLLARSADPAWLDPLVELAKTAYRRSRVVGADPVVAAPWIERSLAFADSAVRRDPASADAVEARGTAQYWGWLIRLYANPADAERRLASARSDLERAIAIDPRRASAWASLSHLHYQPGMGGRTEVLLAARRAYEEDAYLANADKVIQRLFLASYDNGQSLDAERWCKEGSERFPAAPEFVECKVLLMTMRGAVPNVDLAWRLTDSATRLSPQPDRAFRQARGRIIMGAVLARAALSASAPSQALADSSRRVLAATPITIEVDAQGDLHLIEAFALALLGSHDEAFRALRKWHSVTNQVIDLRDTNWWFQSLADDPRYSELTGTGR